MAKNSHLIEARYVGPTNTKGARVRLFSHRFPRDSVTEARDYETRDSVTEARDYETRDIFEQSERILSDLGYTIECAGEMRHGYFFVVSEFLPLRDAAAKLRAARKNGEG